MTVTPSPVFLHIASAPVTTALTLIGVTFAYFKKSKWLSIIVLAGVLAILCEIGLNDLAKQQLRINQRFEEIDDGDKCPEFGAYLAYTQATFNTYPFAIAISTATALFTLLFLLIIRNGNSAVHIPNNTIVLLCMISMFLSFIGTYKLLNCVIGRLCGQDSCSAPYFRK